MYIALSQYEGLPNAFSSFLKTQNCLRCMEGLEDEGKRGGGVIFHICLDRIYKRKRKSKSVILLENIDQRQL